MGLETTTFISGLDAANPLATDPKSQGDDHIRLLKSTVKATFPNVTGAVTPTHLELNYVAGVTSAIQTQLNAEVTNRTNADALKANLASPTFTGTVTIPSGASIAGFAPLSSPALTGVPTAPTATAGTATTQVATTAFVVATSLSASLPGQAGNAGKFITTDGTTPSWAAAVDLASAQTLTSKTLAMGSNAITGTLAQFNTAVTDANLASLTGTETLTNKTMSTGSTWSGNTIPVANGGTGAATHTTNAVLVGNGTSALSSIAPSTSGNVLTSNGTSWASTALPSAANGVGTYVFALNSFSGITIGGTVAGSSLRVAGISSSNAVITDSGLYSLSGTWQAMGYLDASNGASLFLRIA